MIRYCFVQDEAGWGEFLVPLEKRDQYNKWLEKYSMGEELTSEQSEELELLRIGSIFEISFADPR